MRLSVVALGSAVAAQAAASACVPKQYGEFAFGGCVPDGWEPTYDMPRSTSIMYCNYSGYSSAAAASRYGLIDIDWSNAMALWASEQPMDVRAHMIRQAEAQKRAAPHARVWIYRNLVKAESCFGDIREKLLDARYDGFFLQHRNGSKVVMPRCYNTSGAWHLPAASAHCDCGGIVCGTYLFDHRNASLRQWLGTDHIDGPMGVGNAAVDGLYLDDGWSALPTPPKGAAPPFPYNGWWSGRGPFGPSEYDPHWIDTTDYTPADVADITAGWRLTMELAHRTITANNAFNWQMLAGASIAEGQANPANCVDYLRSSCSAPFAAQRRPLLYYLTLNNTNDRHDPSRGGMLSLHQDVAAFLLVRGPYAWLGTGWLGCGFQKDARTCCTGDGLSCREAGADECLGASDGFYDRPAELDMDYGTPEGDCAETVPGESGVFAREWSKVTVSLDCNRWEAGFEWK